MSCCLSDGVARIIIPNSYAAACFETTSEELHQTGTFRMFYQLTYSTAARIKTKEIAVST